MHAKKRFGRYMNRKQENLYDRGRSLMGFAPVQISSLHITHFLWKLSVERSLIKNGRHNSFNQCPSMMWASFHRLNVVILLALMCSAIGMDPKNSGILRRDAWRGVFVARLLQKRSAVTYYYGSIVYKNLSSGCSRFKHYEKSI